MILDTGTVAIPNKKTGKLALFLHLHFLDESMKILNVENQVTVYRDEPFINKMWQK